MKNNKSLLSLGIIALVLFLGVGYAVVNTTNLTIGGTASVKDSKMNVKFSAATVAENMKNKVTATISDDLTATLTVKDLESVGEKVTATYTIQNNDGSLEATITEKGITVTPNDYFKVTTDLGDGQLVAAKEGTVDVTVTVELIKMPVSSANSSASITINLAATPVGE